MKTFAIYDNTEKPDAVKYAQIAAERIHKNGDKVIARPHLIEQFSPQNKEYITECELKDFEKKADYLLTFGGDGTILSAAREMINADIPIIGINLGKLGFLAEFNADSIDEAMDSIFNGDFRIVDRSILETEIDGHKVYALNDFVVEKKETSRMLTVSTYSDEHYVGDYRGDGIIITTPTGSTAYNLSCDGPIIAPSTKVICITPISPHTLTLRPLVVPDTNEVTLIVDSPSGESIFVADGQTEKILKNGESVKVKLSDSKIKLVKPSKVSYYDVLRQKFLWAAHAFDKNIIVKSITDTEK